MQGCALRELFPEHDALPVVMSLEYRFDHRGNVELQSAPARRSLCWLYFVLFVLLQVGVLVWLYSSGYLTPADSRTSVQAISLRGKMDEQERLLLKQAQAIALLEADVASAQRSESIQTASNTLLREKLELAETELAESRRRLLLYDEILSPEALVVGLNVQHLSIKRLFIDPNGKKLAHDRYYQYHLVLTNVRGSGQAVEGSLNISVLGQLDGKSIALLVNDLLIFSETEQQKLAAGRFSLKYYQSLEGRFELPQGFVPTSVEVRLLPAPEEKFDRVTKQYAWETFKLLDKSTMSEE